MIYFLDMGTNILRIVLLITTVQFLLSVRCNKNSTRPCMYSSYSFVITSEWSPQQEVYAVGDTLNLSSTFPKKLTDQINTSIVVDYSNSVGIGGAATFFELDTITHDVIGATSKFDYYSIIGTIGNDVSIPTKSKSLYFAELSTTYSLKIKLVPKQKGLFAFYISNLTSNGLRGKNCTNAGFVNTLTNTNKNLNLFQYAMQRPPASQYEIDRIYCFRVQ